MLSRSRWIGAALLATACDPDVWTERDQLRFHSNLSEAFVLSGDPVLRGATVCLDYAAYRVADDPLRFENDDDGMLSDCYRATLQGPATFDGEGCIALHEVGSVALALERIACALPGRWAHRCADAERSITASASPRSSAARPARRDALAGRPLARRA